MAQIILTGYLVLSQLNTCARDNGFETKFSPEAIPKLKQSNLEGAGCMPFKVMQGSRSDTITLETCGGKYIRLNNEDFTTTQRSNQRTEFSLATVKDLDPITQVTAKILTNQGQPFYLLDSKGGNPAFGVECLRVFPMNNVVDYSEGCGICKGGMSVITRNAAWNFVEQQSAEITCGAGVCPMTLYNGYNLTVKNHPNINANNALLFSPVKFGLRMPVDPFPEFIILPPEQTGFGFPVQSAMQIKRFCFEARKILRIFLILTNNSGGRTTIRLKPKKATKFRKICLSEFPDAPVSKIELRFTRFDLTDLLFIRHLDIAGCKVG